MAFVRRTGAAVLALSNTPSRSGTPTEASGHHRGLPLSSSLRVGRRCRSLWITAMVVGSTTGSESRPAYGEAWTEKRSTPLCGTSPSVAWHFITVCFRAQCTNAAVSGVQGFHRDSPVRAHRQRTWSTAPCLAADAVVDFRRTLVRHSLVSSTPPSLKRVKRHARHWPQQALDQPVTGAGSCR